MHNANTVNPSGGGIVWQPIAMAPAKTPYNVTGNKLISIRVFSISNIILGILSIGLQIAALVIYATSIYNYVYLPLDIVGHGIWCGCFYVTAGSLGVAACNKKTKSLLIGTVVMSALSIAGSIVASTLSGFVAGYGVSYNCYGTNWSAVRCNTWLGLEWSLMSASILAFCCSVTLVTIASVPLCCSKRNYGSERNTKVTVGIGNNQQPMYFQPQPIYVAAQQQSNVQFTRQQPGFLQPKSNMQAVNSPQQLQPELVQQAPLVHPQQPQLPQQAPVVHQQHPK